MRAERHAGREWRGALRRDGVCWAERRGENGLRGEGVGLETGFGFLGFLFFWVFSSFLFQTSLKLIEFKFEFEFKP